MKTNLFSALCAIMVLMTATTLASCNNSTSAQPEAVPVQLDDEESWSLVDFGGEIIAKNAFDNTPSYVYNGTFVVKEEDGLYVHHISDPKKALNSEPFLQLTNFASGHAFGVRPGTGILLVNTDGEVIKQLSDDIATVYVPVPLGALDFLPYKDTDEKAGYIKASGDIAIKAKWDTAMPFSEGLAMVFNNDDRYTCIDTNGEKVFSLREGESMVLPLFLNGWLAVNKDDRGHFVDHKGETVMKLSHGTAAVARIGDRVLARNSDGWMILEAKEDGEKILKGYESITPLGLDGTRFLVRKRSDSKFRVVDANGEDVGDNRIENFNDMVSLCGYIFGGDEKPYTLYDKNGEPVNKKLDIDVIGNEEYLAVFSQKIYNKKQVAALVDIIGNSASFGGAEGVPSVSNGETASTLLPEMGISAEDAFTYIDSGSYRVSKSISDDLGVLYATFATSPADWTFDSDGWTISQRYFYREAPVSLLAIETPVNTDSRTATAYALIDALMDKGWERAGGHSHELRNSAGNYVYIVPSTYCLRIVCSFGQLDYNTVMGSALHAPSANNDDYYLSADSDSVAVTVPTEEVAAVDEY